MAPIKIYVCLPLALRHYFALQNHISKPEDMENTHPQKLVFMKMAAVGKV